MSYSKLGLDRILDVKFGLCNFENGIVEGKTKFEKHDNKFSYLFEQFIISFTTNQKEK